MGFLGFSEEGDVFFQQLAVRQDREWFKAHKADYERLWVQPMKELLAALRPGLEKAFQPFKLAPEKHFRIYRDVRFSKDKSPFKTYQAAMIKLEGPAGSDSPEYGPAALYLHVGTEDIVTRRSWRSGSSTRPASPRRWWWRWRRPAAPGAEGPSSF